MLKRKVPSKDFCPESTQNWGKLDWIWRRIGHKHGPIVLRTMAKVCFKSCPLSFSVSIPTGLYFYFKLMAKSLNILLWLTFPETNKKCCQSRWKLRGLKFQKGNEFPAPFSHNPLGTFASPFGQKWKCVIDANWGGPALSHAHHHSGHRWHFRCWNPKKSRRHSQGAIYSNGKHVNSAGINNTFCCFYCIFKIIFINPFNYIFSSKRPPINTRNLCPKTGPRQVHLGHILVPILKWPIQTILSQTLNFHCPRAASKAWHMTKWAI